MKHEARSMKEKKMSSKKFYRLKNPSSWRRLSIANWKTPSDPTVYGSMAFDWTKAKNFLEEQNKKSDVKITPTHFMAKAIALVFRKYPDLNGIICWGQIYLRKTVDIFLQVAIEADTPDENQDLSGAKIDSCDTKTLSQIAKELKIKSQNIRKKNDPQFKQTLNMINIIPTFLLSFVLRILGILIHNLRVNLPSLGLVQDPFGSAMVTSVGMFGLPPGYAPLVPMSRVPLVVCMGEISDKPWVESGQVICRLIAEVKFTFDHRFIDGLKGAQMSNYLKKIIEEPEKYMM